ncbi:AAA family ATPase [Sulfurimonas lithotrophica]|uniref:AAA family ATPase n=1 Tax=Sulfurimonas lithotrophica TaxID=2590022 RepID=A0A5P8P233_9BACT|nr:TniB family NTP-binding protein [Sulfurimonas lithotrophica]QFR49793.1 AAA family ATPase [Sulfurimonas lithotrophica]
MSIELSAKTQKVLTKSDEERIEYIEQEYWIDYPIAERILEKLEKLYKYGPGKTRTISMLLVGGSNNGKTTLLQEFIDKHPPYDYNLEGEKPNWVTDEYFERYTGIGIPVLSIIAPRSPSETRLYSIILQKLNVPFKSKDTVDIKGGLVNYYLKALNVQVLVIDEIHNILKGPTVKQLQIMSTIRDLSTELKIPIVLAGVKDALRAVGTEEQISSRYRPEYLTKWKMNEDYINLLATIVSRLPLKKESTILNEDDAKKILEMSKGYIGEIVNIVKSAAIYAIETGSERVTIKEIKECDFNTLENVDKSTELKDV